MFNLEILGYTVCTMAFSKSVLHRKSACTTQTAILANHIHDPLQPLIAVTSNPERCVFTTILRHCELYILPNTPLYIIVYSKEETAGFVGT